MLLLSPAPNAPGCLLLQQISAFPFSRLQPGPVCPLHQLNWLPPPGGQLLAVLGWPRTPGTSHPLPCLKMVFLPQLGPFLKRTTCSGLVKLFFAAEEGPR